MFHLIKTFPYITGFVVSILAAIVLFATGILGGLVEALNNFGYLGAFLSGFTYSSTFTASIAAFFFVELGGHLHSLTVIVLGGIGAMLGDLFFYWIIKDGVGKEVAALLLRLMPGKGLKRLERFTKRRVFLWTMPFLASLLIASPLPDELGVALFGLINFRMKYLSLVSFLLNTAGIATLVFIGSQLTFDM